MEASNWLAALGEGLGALGRIDMLQRLACELLPNGRVVARDVRTGRGFVVTPLDRAGAGGSERAPLPARAGVGDDAAPPWHGGDGSLDDGRPDDHDVFAQPADDDEDVEDSGTPLAEDVIAAPDERTDPWAETRGPLGEPESATTRLVLDLLERVRRAPSELLAWHEALDAARALVPSEAGAALEREPDARLRFLHAFGPRSAGVQGAVLPAGIGIAGFAAERVASVLVQDTQQDPRFCSDLDEVTGFSTHAVLCVPVAYEGRVFGCLELLNPLLPGGYDRPQLELVEMVADTLAARLATEG
ncbi:MAG: GAF domain-containing protein [Deltaproteobacteria bacterium]|nr:MAG: GAF domain-containing protein [Deltaproteobacteria bacterium]